MNRDEEHLRLLSIFHYVVAGIHALIACVPILHFSVGLFLVVSPKALQDNHGQGPPEFIGWMFLIFGAAFIIVGWTFALCIFAAGRCLAKRKRRLFCLVMAGIECAGGPFAAVLGAFTLVVLLRESVRTLFDDPPAAELLPAQAS